MGRPPLNPSGPMTATERSKKRYALHRESILRHQRKLYKIAASKKKAAGLPVRKKTPPLTLILRAFNRLSAEDRATFLCEIGNGSTN
jgi:hypothetical protein